MRALREAMPARISCRSSARSWRRSLCRESSSWRRIRNRETDRTIRIPKRVMPVPTTARMIWAVSLMQTVYDIRAAGFPRYSRLLEAKKRNYRASYGHSKSYSSNSTTSPARYTFRRKYAEFLRIDFPRVPFNTNRELFAELADLGARLARLHLLESPELDPPACRFEGKGDARVAKTKAQGFRYDADEERVYVNRTQYFGPLPREIYEYRIGGYQVCQKWLKDRRERRLELDDIRTYCRIVTAIGHTLTIQHQIDALYPEADSTPL